MFQTIFFSINNVDMHIGISQDMQEVDLEVCGFTVEADCPVIVLAYSQWLFTISLQK